MHWERLFEDLEGQLSAEWESERAALDAESERLRISRLTLHDRLRILCADSAPVLLDLPDLTRMHVRLRALGADWIAATPMEGAHARSTHLIPLHAVRGVHLDHGSLLTSVESREGGGLRERMSFGFVLRDLARRRQPVTVLRIHGTEQHGTIDRAGADHLDLALHDPGTTRVASAVHGFCMVPLAAITCVLAAGDQMP